MAHARHFCSLSRYPVSNRKSPSHSAISASTPIYLRTSVIWDEGTRPDAPRENPCLHSLLIRTKIPFPSGPTYLPRPTVPAPAAQTYLRDVGPEKTERSIERSSAFMFFSKRRTSKQRHSQPRASEQRVTGTAHLLYTIARAPGPGRSVQARRQPVARGRTAGAVTGVSDCVYDAPPIRYSRSRL